MKSHVICKIMLSALIVSLQGNNVRANLLNGGCLLERYMKNAGFHRDLFTRIILPGLYSSQTKNCTLLLIEEIPSGAYVDLHQVKSQLDFGGPMVYSTEEFDIEAPEHVSKSHEIYVFGNLTDIDGVDLVGSISLSIHLRYHRPWRSSGHVHVKFPLPKILVSCEGSGAAFEQVAGDDVFSPCDPLDDSVLCAWRELTDCHMDKDVPFLRAAVPVGNLDHTTLVVAGTLTVTIGATAYLVWLMMNSNTEWKQLERRGGDSEVQSSGTIHKATKHIEEQSRTVNVNTEHSPGKPQTRSRLRKKHCKPH